MPLRTLGLASRTYRHVNRYRQILTVLFRYGFGELIDRLRISQYLELGLQFFSTQKREQVETLSTSERVRMVLEELGPTFIKLGQVLSTRPDLVGSDLADELSKLQQHVPAFPFEQARQIVEQELGQPIEAVYARFEPQAMAAASIGQVHRARLLAGADVVVKVQRPNIRGTIEVDLEILQHLAGLAERHLENFKLHKPTRIVEEFARVLERELNYLAEAAHVERFANLLAGDDTIYVPKVFRSACTERVLTLEFIDVIHVTDLDALRRRGLSPETLAARGTQLTLKQIFVLGFFHADPHPGNVFALPGNVICLLDFGMMGRLDRQGREDFADLIYAAAVRDTPRLTHALLRMTEHDDEIEPDPRALERDMAEFVDVNIPSQMRDLNFGQLVRDLMTLVSRHRLRIPADLVMMLKAAATIERVVQALDPGLNVIAAAAPYVRKLKLDRLRPRRWLRELSESGGEAFQFLRDIPSGLRDLMRQAKRGGLRIGFEHRGLDRLIDSNERIANRLSFSIVVAALIVGSSLIVLSQIPPKWYEVPVIGIVGFLAAGVMGFLLLLAIIRHGRL